MSTTERPLLRGFVALTSLAAFAWVVTFYTLCLRVYWAIGMVPTNKHDRLQARLENGPHDLIVGYGLIALVVLFVPWVAAYAFTRREETGATRLARLLPLEWAPMALVFVVDPWHLFWGVYFD